jgi:OOP family OmpA-OmpF porin
MRSTAQGAFAATVVGCALGALAVCAPGRDARADNAIPAANGAGMDTHLFRPAMDSKGFFTVNGTEVLGANQTSFGLIIDYGNDLLRVADKGQSSPQLINHSFTGTFQFNYGLWNRLVVGVDVPVGLVVGDQQADSTGAATSPGMWSTASTNSQTLDYLGAHAKWRITRLTDPVGLALGVQIGGSPTSAPHNAGADPGFFYWPQLMAEKQLGTGGWFKLGANAGYRGHTGRGTVLDLRNGLFDDGDLFTYGGAISFRVLDPLELIAETYGTYLVKSDAASGVKPSNEVVGGLKLYVEKNSYFTLGAGPRYTNGFEAANVRAFLGFVFEPSIGDRDGDGIPDDIDKCPDEPEDKDGFQDDDGCPDPDNDNDGIPDIDDKCPNEPEDRDGDHDEDGCPEVTDGDRDGDGIPDSRDKCPDVPEDRDGFEDEDGCPDPDNDKDGIPDVVDKCPNEPETFNGFEDEDGCPDKGKVIIQDNNIIILDKIKFKTGSAEILPESDPILDAVATTIEHHPEFVLMEIAGHADERATDKYNLSLTQRRVDSVRAAILKRGVPAAKVRSKGYGEYCPEDPEHNEEAWEKNRRVEFKIVKTQDGPTGVELGCANATSHGVSPDPIP